jgi:hypothetical protein
VVPSPPERSMPLKKDSATIINWWCVATGINYIFVTLHTGGGI